MEVGRTYPEKGFLCRREVSLELEHPRIRQKMRPEKDLEEKDIRGS
jgi:hypothetical protein